MPRGFFHRGKQFTKVEYATIEGMDEVLQKMGDLIDSIDSPQLEKEMIKAARIPQMDARRRVRKKSGATARAIVVKEFKKKRIGEPAVFMAMNYKISRLGHLLEFGAKGRKPGGNMPPYPFFRPAVWGNINLIAHQVHRGVKRIIDKAI